MTTTETTTHTVDVDGIGPIEVTLTRRGDGPVFLVLHGGAGPASVAGFADLLADAACVLTPTHPGFDGSARPAGLDSIRGLAQLYVALLDRLDVTDVTVVGNSIGGWTAAEIALLGSPRVARLVLVGATGIEVPGHPVADVFALTQEEIVRRSFHRPEPFLVDPSAVPPAVRTVMAANRAALSVYGGPTGCDPGLLDRLPRVDVATLVVWGESDRIVDPDYGRAYAAAVPSSRFQLLPDAGHVPQVETPRELVSAVREFVATCPAWSSDCVATTTVAREDIWAALRALYTGAERSDDGDTIEIHGPFEVGTALSVTPHGADLVIRCTITELVEGEVYAYRSAFDGLFITSRHRLTSLAAGGTQIIQHSTVAGPGAERVGSRIGARVTADHPEAMAGLIAAARSRSAGSPR